MQDQMFDRRLGMLFVSDAVRAIPEGTSVLSDVNRPLAHRHSPRRRSLVIVSSVTAVALGLLLAVTPARAAVGDFLRFAFVQRFGTVLVTPPATPDASASAGGGQSGPVPHAHATPSLPLSA